MRLLKYKVGDIVKVRSDLEENIWYGSDNVAKDMLKYLGDYVTIDKIDGAEYRIQQDNGMYRWTDEMFEDEPVIDVLPKIISWLGEHYTDGTYMKVFDCECPLNVLVTLYSTLEIVQRIQKYEEENNGKI